LAQAHSSAKPSANTIRFTIFKSPLPVKTSNEQF
jgi:hypothetical protein